MLAVCLLEMKGHKRIIDEYDYNSSNVWIYKQMQERTKCSAQGPEMCTLEQRAGKISHREQKQCQLEIKRSVCTVAASLGARCVIMKGITSVGPLHFEPQRR